MERSKVDPVWSVYEESWWISDWARGIDAHTDTLALRKKVKG